MTWKTIKVLCFLILSLTVWKNAVFSQTGFSFGGKKWGLGFGHFQQYNGVRLNFIDFVAVEDLEDELYMANGVNLSIIDKYDQINGCSFSLVSGGYQRNGIFIDVLYTGALKINGINICCLSSNFETIRGIAFAPLNKALQVDGGIQLGLVNLTPWKGMHTLMGWGGRVGDPSVYGFIFGALNWTRADVYGLQLGFFNHSRDIYGLSLGLVNISWRSNISDKRLKYYNRYNDEWRVREDCGFSKAFVQAGIFNKGMLNMGLQFGCLNLANEGPGWQVGAINWRNVNKSPVVDYNDFWPSYFQGDYNDFWPSFFQIGLFNFSDHGRGFQFGLINTVIKSEPVTTHKGQGIQIGLINIRKENKWYARVLPLFNTKI